MNAALATRSLRTLLDGYASDIPELAVTGLALDSRQLQPGALFLAVQGTATHGLAHAEAALKRGATAIAWESAAGVSAPALPVPTIAVPNLSRHAGEIAARWYRQPSAALFTAGITGTDGKTSTAHLIAQALDRLDVPCAYFGTLGYGRLGRLADASHTTPDPVRLQALLADSRDAGAQACAMEVSSHALDQARVGGVAFDVAVLTNVGRDHLDYHGTVEHYAAAKRRLFASDGLAAAVLNRDDVHGARWADELLAEGRTPVVVYGLDGAVPASGQYLIGRTLRLHAAGLTMQIDSSWGGAQLDCRLLGRFNAHNLLAALAVLLVKGIALADAVSALAESQTVPGRIEAFRAEHGPLVVVDYAHTPQALDAVLRAVRAHTAGKLVCVFGCGGDRDRGKRPLMGAAAVNGADVAIVTDDNPRSESPAAIAADIVAGLPQGKTVRVIHDRAEAIRAAIAEAGSDDVVLVAGKGHEDYQLYGAERRSFSDRAYVAQALGLAVRT
ncbi:UDP-N-acetylmuramoyl-L-alanyl-D-glutamate--2,6-diaminopimelate ligase [Nevskia ramosa]|uniref:UDP-N-acetylmuramoyl-L-alanyl-D-glutamate--2, 6-diaminopimelate ligase n=1 Tax=Nevskia ramosa TaxID=64002 RepID=UPI0003B759A7|nr:UDP-N-acetylmuramoyl-L-alanyl-D-glutamate--2,6-diaminopimelate ligase [Nevskia ramosa]